MRSQLRWSPHWQHATGRWKLDAGVGPAADVALLLAEIDAGPDVASFPGGPQASQPTSSWLSSLRQKVTSGSDVTPTSRIIGSISERASPKNAWKLSGSGHSSTIMIWPSSDP